MSEPIKSITIVSNDTSTIITLPSGDTVDIMYLESWDKLQPKQQLYITLIAKNVKQPTLARIKTGIDKSEYKEWLAQDSFLEVMEDVENIFTEQLIGIDFLDAINNPKVRGRVLQANKAKGYETKHNTTTNNNLILSSEKADAKIKHLLGV